MNYNLIVLVIFLLGMLTVYRLYTTFSIKTFGVYKTFKKIGNYATLSKNRIRRRDNTEKVLRFLHKHTESVVLLTHSEKRKEDTEYVALRMNLKIYEVNITSEYLQGLIDTATLIFLTLSLFLTILDTRFVAFTLFYKMVPKLILELFSYIIKDYDKEIEKEFYKFHSCYFNLYKHKSNQNIPIPTVAQNCYNSVGPQLQRMIDLMQADFKTNSSKALDNLKNHYRLAKVYRFCNEMKLIQSGRAVDMDMLEEFQNELKAEHRLLQKKELENKKLKAENIMGISGFIMVEVLIYWSICAVLLNK